MASEEQAAATTARFRAAVEAGDVEALIETLAPDSVLHSPITDGFKFTGDDEIRGLMPDVFAVVEDIHYTEDVGDAHTRALFYTARIGTVNVEEATRVRLDDDARVTDVTLWFRPLPALTALMAGLGPRLAKKNGRARGAAAAAMTKPLAAMTRSGDKVAVKLVRPGSTR
jgi:hypothetical protein